jgi:hypothetical protein
MSTSTASSPNTAAAETEKEVSNETATLPSSCFIGLEQITGDDAAPVPLIEQIAAINDEKSDYKSRVGLEQITGNDATPTQPLNFGDFVDSSSLNVAADFAKVHEDDEPIIPTNHHVLMGNTEPTTDIQTSTTPSDVPFENTTTNVLHDEEEQSDHLIEAYLVVEVEEGEDSSVGGGIDGMQRRHLLRNSRAALVEAKAFQNIYHNPYICYIDFAFIDGSIIGSFSCG